MGQKKNQPTSGANAELANEKTVEILYQKMAGKWYSFYVIDDDVFVSPVSAEVVEAARKDQIDKLQEK